MVTMARPSRAPRAKKRCSRRCWRQTRRTGQRSATRPSRTRSWGRCSRRTARATRRSRNIAARSRSDEMRLRADPSDRTTQLDSSFSYASLGYLLSTVPDVAGSLEYYGRALELRERAAAADVHDVRARETVARGAPEYRAGPAKAKRRAGGTAAFPAGARDLLLARRTANPRQARTWPSRWPMPTPRWRATPPGRQPARPTPPRLRATGVTCAAGRSRASRFGRPRRRRSPGGNRRKSTPCARW